MFVVLHKVSNDNKQKVKRFFELNSCLFGPNEYVFEQAVFRCLSDVFFLTEILAKLSGIPNSMAHSSVQYGT